MFHRRFRLAISLVGVLAGVSAGERTVVNDQSPRQALIEMLSGGEAPFKKHLTVEMQGKLQNMMKASLDNAPSPLQLLLGINSSANKFQAFDIGPTLFAFYNPQEHQRYEIAIDGEDRRGDQDIMELSLHLVRNAVEKEVPGSLRFIVNMKRQEGIWRLNALTMNATLPIGDPRVLDKDKSWWTPMITAAMGPTDDVTADTPVVIDERPKMTPLRAVRMIGMASSTGNAVQRQTLRVRNGLSAIRSALSSSWSPSSLDWTGLRKLRRSCSPCVRMPSPSRDASSCTWCSRRTRRTRG